MEQSDLWKRVLEPVKEVVLDANLECSPSGIQLQAMDPSHVSLVTLLLRSEGFKQYSCSRNVNLGINLSNMSKILKCANKDDSVTLRYEGQDALTFLVESSGHEKVSEFVMRLMEIEGESLGIPEQTYSATISMGSSDFSKLCRDMMTFGESVQISVAKDHVKFTTRGDFGQGSTTVRPTIAADLTRTTVKQEQGVKQEPGAQEDTKEGILPEAIQNETGPSKNAVLLSTDEEVCLNFALKNLVNFTKASGLSDRVTLRIAMNEPLQVEYKIENFGYMRFYLAPKVDDEADLPPNI